MLTQITKLKVSNVARVDALSIDNELYYIPVIRFLEDTLVAIFF